LEFDLPDEFRTVTAGAPGAVTGFRIGYFRGGDPAVIRTVDFSRETLAVQGRTARVTLPREAISICADDCTVRIQTLSGARASVWSEPVPLETRAVSASPPNPQPAAPSRAARTQRPSPPRPQRAAPPRAAGTQRPRSLSPEQRRAGLVLTDVEPYGALTQALRALLPPGAAIEAEVKRFRRVQDVALAVAISREHDIPFTTLSRAMEGPPRLTPRNALAKLRPDLDTRAVRKVRPEARKLIAQRDDPPATQ
jgi:hypothetical protein